MFNINPSLNFRIITHNPFLQLRNHSLPPTILAHPHPSGCSSSESLVTSAPPTSYPLPILMRTKLPSSIIACISNSIAAPFAFGLVSIQAMWQSFMQEILFSLTQTTPGNLMHLHSRTLVRPMRFERQLMVLTTPWLNGRISYSPSWQRS